MKTAQQLTIVFAALLGFGGAHPLSAQSLSSNAPSFGIVSPPANPASGGLAIQPKAGHGPINATAGGWQATATDQNSKTWGRVTSGTNLVGAVTTKRSHLVELNAGMNKTGPGGTWIPASEEIKINPAGGAFALDGSHQVWFPSDITGVLKLQTPGTQVIQSRVTGISLFDGTNAVMIGTVKSSRGQLVLNDQTNQIIYPDAF